MAVIIIAIVAIIVAIVAMTIAIVVIIVIVIVTSSSSLLFLRLYYIKVCLEKCCCHVNCIFSEKLDVRIIQRTAYTFSPVSLVSPFSSFRVICSKRVYVVTSGFGCSISKIVS